ncbi:hypothetical protein RYX36_037121 [Vicia faba]
MFMQTLFILMPKSMNTVHYALSWRLLTVNARCIILGWGSHGIEEFSCDKTYFGSLNSQFLVFLAPNSNNSRQLFWIDGTSVPVKRIDAEERGEREFKSEVAAIASVHHVNLVRLFGYCNSSSAPRYLVYDFISNGSLDCWIFPKRDDSQRRPRRSGSLSWNLRYKVAMDVAKGLAYLHHDCRSRILHLDIKPENILLDESFRALVSDFGLSKLTTKDESQAAMSTIRNKRLHGT